MNMLFFGFLGFALIVIGGYIRTKTLVIDFHERKIKLVDTKKYQNTLKNNCE